jgi:hypothetical protein
MELADKFRFEKYEIHTSHKNEKKSKKISKNTCKKRKTMI